MSLYSIVNPEGTTVSLDFSKILSTSPRTLLYFYPKDDTPGCTLEGQDFTRLKEDFLSKGIQIIGVSLDDVKSHNHFQISCGIGIPLISDDGSLVRQFAVMGEKNMYGKKIFGMLRSSFLLDSTGKILEEWRNVRATGHAERLLKEIQ